MRYQIDHDLHIHSQLSSCSSDPEQNAETILNYAKRYGLHTVCMTDHYWDSSVPIVPNWYSTQNFDHIAQSLPLPQSEETAFLFGCETELDKNLTLAIPDNRFSDFEFVIIPTTHLHMSFNIAEEDKNNNERIAALWVKRLDHVLSRNLPFEKIGIAHLACHLINKNGHLPVLDLIPTEEMERVFTKAAKCGCGIELNSSDFCFSDADADRVLRIFRVAKGCGCKFYLGSDAHHPKQLDAAISHFDRAITLLDLTENDKFRIPVKQK